MALALLAGSGTGAAQTSGQSSYPFEWGSLRVQYSVPGASVSGARGSGSVTALSLPAPLGPPGLTGRLGGRLSGSANWDLRFDALGEGFARLNLQAVGRLDLAANPAVAAEAAVGPGLVFDRRVPFGRVRQGVAVVPFAASLRVTLSWR